VDAKSAEEARQRFDKRAIYVALLFKSFLGGHEWKAKEARKRENAGGRQQVLWVLRGGGDVERKRGRTKGARGRKRGGRERGEGGRGRRRGGNGGSYGGYVLGSFELIHRRRKGKEEGGGGEEKEGEGEEGMLGAYSVLLS